MNNSASKVPARRQSTQPALDRLSPREREVLDGIVRGLTNKTIGIELGISHRTVEIHRARVMRKLGATSIAGLITAVLAEGGAPSPPPSAKAECPNTTTDDDVLNADDRDA